MSAGQSAIATQTPRNDRLDFQHVSETANDPVSGAPVTLREVAVGSVRATDVAGQRERRRDERVPRAERVGPSSAGRSHRACRGQSCAGVLANINADRRDVAG